MTVPVILVDRPSDGVTVLTLNRPRRLNAFDAELIAALPAILDGLAVDETTRVVVVTGAGRGFCAGADLEHHGLAATDPVEIATWLREVHRGALALHTLSQVTIAAVNGAAAGGGLGLALGCDIASPRPVRSSPPPSRRSDSDRTSESRSCSHVPSASPPPMELLLTGRRVDAAEAQRIGVVNRIEEEPLAASISLAAEIASLPAGLAGSIKQTVRQSLTMDFEAVLTELEPKAQASLIAGRLGGGKTVGDLRRLRTVRADVRAAQRD